MKRFQIRTPVTEFLPYKTLAATEQAKFSLTRRFVRRGENESISSEGDKKMLKGFTEHG